MHRTKFKYENKQRAIAQKLSRQELRFMCTALPLDEIYPPTKFHNHSKYSFGDMHQTKFKYESKQRAIIKKISKHDEHNAMTIARRPSARAANKKSKQELWFLCTALRLDEIYSPTKFHNCS